ncbi:MULTISPECIES: LysE family translocator [Kitasatospora]|uniref:Putative LysE family protein n=1 Tax=Kitasatospora setae (strain ATCC 33774 / DSM 43861 / JCM 3304 / KCC A-0304 / NBRC 14216 / KM-6054) TaxID=452652 RepID=E4NBY2_KITSK|nr:MULTISPECIES: LysE family translocator [Kitasatospora]BAJ28713.1 putative LysE family protein [Kitasatospora setae KM-6054]
MVSAGSLAGIALVALGLVLTPGPNMIYLVSRSIVQGRRAGLFSLLGVAAGFLAYLLAAVTGIAALFTLVPGVYAAVKYAGALYLGYLAFNALRPGGVNAFAPKPLPPDPPLKLFTMGLVTNLLNPKIAILYLSVLPQFTDPARGSVAGQSLVLGLVQISIALTVNGLIAFGAGAIAAFLRDRPRWLRIQRLVMGATLAAIAVRVATA